MYFSVDRKVGNRAMLMGEDKKPMEVPVGMLPEGTREGDVVLYKGGAFLPAKDKTAERRARVSEMLKILLNQADDYTPGDDDEPTDKQGGPD